jgi:metal-sulfur cluster biosynthetic enzyme
VTPSTESNVKNFLKTIRLPGISQTLGEVGQITEAELADGRATVKIELGFPAESAFATWRDDIAEAIMSETGASAVDVESRCPRSRMSSPWLPAKVASGNRRLR